MYDQELEKAMLYFIIFEKEEAILAEKDFVNKTNKNIIKAINKLKSAKQEISILNIAREIKDEKNILEYLSNLNDNIFGSTAENTYRKIKELTKKRETYLLAQAIAKQVVNNENIDIFIEKEHGNGKRERL